VADRLAKWAAWLIANPYTKVLAMLIAVTAWLFVQQDVAREAMVPVRLRFVLPEGLVSPEPLRGQIVLRVEGPRAATNRARALVATQEVDLGHLAQGEHVVDLVGLDWSEVVESLRIVAVEPPSLTLELDELFERKVQVETRRVGVPPAAYDVLGIAIEPGVVPLVGPRKVVSRLERVFIEPLDVSGVTERTSVDAPLDLPWGVSAVGAVPRATIDVVVVERTIEDLEVPIVVRGGDGYEADPGRIRVSLRGPATFLEWIGSHNVIAFVRLDPGAPDQVDARYGPNRGHRIEIWHPGGPEVSVTDVEPSQVRLERR